MTFIGWIQILLFCAVVVAIVKPLGGYMTKVFNGERTFLSPVLRPVEAGLYWVAGVDEKREQHWLTYAISMLIFQVAGFVVLYTLMRLQAGLPFNPAEQSAVAPDLSFNTAVSFVTNTNWQNYGGESTMSYLTQMMGLTTQNFALGRDGRCDRRGVDPRLRSFFRADGRKLLGRSHAHDALRPSAYLCRRYPVLGLAGNSADTWRLC